METAHANQGAWSDPVPLSAACNVRCKANDAYLEAVGKVAKALNVCGAFVLDVPADKLIVARSVMDFCDALFFKQSQAKRMELAKAANLPEQLCARTDHGAAFLQFKMGQGLPEPFCGQHDLVSSAFETLDEVARTALQLVCAALKLGSRDACTHALEDPIAGSTTSCSSVTWFGYEQGAHLPEHVDRGLVTLVYAPYDAGSSATELMITRDAAAGWHKLTLCDGQVCVLVGHTLARFASVCLAPKHFAPTVERQRRRTCVYRLKARGDAVIVDGKTAKQIEAELGHSINTAQVGPSTPVAREDGAGASSSRGVKRGRDNNNFVVKVKAQDGSIHQFKIYKDTKMSAVFRAYARILSQPPYMVDERILKFLFKGNRIRNDHTPEQIGLVEGDEIDAMLEMSGD
ncbi:ubiquitin-like domain-containing protein [Pycnococcus provasolii]